MLLSDNVCARDHLLLHPKRSTYSKSVLNNIEYIFLLKNVIFLCYSAIFTSMSDCLVLSNSDYLALDRLLSVVEEFINKSLEVIFVSLPYYAVLLSSISDTLVFSNYDWLALGLLVSVAEEVIQKSLDVTCSHFCFIFILCSSVIQYKWLFGIE